MILLQQGVEMSSKEETTTHVPIVIFLINYS